MNAQLSKLSDHNFIAESSGRTCLNMLALIRHLLTSAAGNSTCDPDHNRITRAPLRTGFSTRPHRPSPTVIHAMCSQARIGHAAL